MLERLQLTLQDVLFALRDRALGFPLLLPIGVSRGDGRLAVPRHSLVANEDRGITSNNIKRTYDKNAHATSRAEDAGG